jgi:hypothetical protein
MFFMAVPSAARNPDGIQPNGRQHESNHLKTFKTRPMLAMNYRGPFASASTVISRSLRSCIQRCHCSCYPLLHLRFRSAPLPRPCARYPRGNDVWARVYRRCRRSRLGCAKAEEGRSCAGAVQYCLWQLSLLQAGAVWQLPRIEHTGIRCRRHFGYSHTAGGYDGGQASMCACRMPMWAQR